MPTSLRIITNSELKTHRRCAAEHHMSYELGYRSAADEAEALRFGTLIHTALEAWWRARDGERLTYALAALDPATDPYDYARAAEMVLGYDTRWSSEPLTMVAVEREFRAPMINPYTGAPSRTFQIGGKMDVLVIDQRDGRLYIIEHKTSSEDLSPGSMYWQLLRLDAQISMYYAGARGLGLDPAGVIYDVLGKPKLRPLKATPIEQRQYRQKDGALYANQRAEDETPDEYARRIRAAIIEDPDSYFVRGVVVRIGTEEADAQWDVWQQARLIREGELAKRWPRNPDGCRRYGRICSYFGVCTATETLDDPRLFVHVDNVHQELTPDVKH